MKLLLQAILKYLTGLGLVATLLFLPAGSFRYMNGWLFLALLFLPILILGILLFIKAPELLEKRLRSKEKQPAQKRIVAILGLLFILGFAVAGLDYRFGWSHIPTWVVIVASLVLLISYGLYAEVVRENEYLSRTIEVQQNQKVIDTGLYGIVRHPMYGATLWLFLSIPLVLGSWWALLCFFPYCVIIVLRIVDEEKFLEENLDGYGKYKRRIKYRLIPFLW